MKLSARDAARFAAAPDLSLSGVLIYGEDGVEVAARRKRIVEAILGGDPQGDLRVTRMTGAEARRDPAALADAMRARGFFAEGRQIALVEEAGDGAAPALSDALEGLTPEDAFLIVTAGVLPARSKLRKIFETAKTAAAAPCYGDPPDRAAVAAMLREAGLTAVSEDALRDIELIARGAEAGALRDFIQRLSLYMLSAEGPVQPADLAATAPGAAEADLDAALDAVADGRAEAIGPLIARLAAQGATPVSVVIAGQRYFRRMHTVLAAGDGGGLEAAVGRLRPPVFGPRRDGLIRRCRVWKGAMVEGALKLLLETDDALRGGVAGGAGFAVLERALLKLAISAQRRR